MQLRAIDNAAFHRGTGKAKTLQRQAAAFDPFFGFAGGPGQIELEVPDRAIASRGQ